MENFEMFFNGRIIFGKNEVLNIYKILKEKNIENVMIISDRKIKKLGVLKKIMDSLVERDILVTEFLDVEANPSIETVEKAKEVFVKSDAKLIIAVGGGSPMDVAKAVAILGTNEGNIRDYEGLEKVLKDTIPLIAVPTTAGTGSEVTAFSVITDKLNNYKLTVASKKIIPQYAILDPTLITSLPRLVAASTGIDALVHAIESYTSKAANSYTEAMAEKAISLIGKNLKKFVNDRNDMEAASNMLLASTYAGISFAGARLGNVHAMAHPLGGFFDIPHGIANAVLLPHVLEFNSSIDNEKYKKMYYLLTEKSVEDFKVSKLIDEIKTLLKDLSIFYSLSELGATADKIDEMSVDAMKSGNILVNPRKTTIDDIKLIYGKAM